MEQTKIESFIEAFVGTAIGFLVSFVAWPAVAWLCDAPVTTKQQAGIVACFTVISLVRGYIIRRWFNGWLKRFNKQLSLWICSKLQGVRHAGNYKR